MAARKNLHRVYFKVYRKTDYDIVSLAVSDESAVLFKDLVKEVLIAYANNEVFLLNIPENIDRTMLDTYRSKKMSICFDEDIEEEKRVIELLKKVRSYKINDFIKGVLRGYISGPIVSSYFTYDEDKVDAIEIEKKFRNISQLNKDMINENNQTEKTRFNKKRPKFIKPIDEQDAEYISEQVHEQVLESEPEPEPEQSPERTEKPIPKQDKPLNNKKPQNTDIRKTPKKDLHTANNSNNGVVPKSKKNDAASKHKPKPQNKNDFKENTAENDNAQDEYYPENDDLNEKLMSIGGSQIGNIEFNSSKTSVLDSDDTENN